MPLLSTSIQAAASAFASPTGTKGAIRPPSSISLGPEGQSVETTGVPTAIASVSTLPDPSANDDRTKRLDFAIQAQGVSTNPGSCTRSARPVSAIIFSKLARSGPSPRIKSREGTVSFMSRKASKSVWWSLFFVSLPTVMRTGSSKFSLSHG